MKHNQLIRNFAVSTLLSCSLFSGCVSKTSSSASPILPAPKIAQTDPEQESRDLPAATLSLEGKTLSGWKKTDFGGRGEISVTNEVIKIGMGAELSGINWTNAAVLPKINYEIELDAMKLEGSDFFCGLTIPFSNSFCTFVVGGWGGGIVGISSVNGADASENDTTRNLYFERNRWYHIRVQVTPQKIVAWIDQDKVVDLEIDGRKISMRGGDIERSVPLGIATWQTSAGIKNIRLKKT
jgi:hypothetical protein